MQNFTYCVPTEILFGKDTEKECAKEIRKHGGSRVMIVYGKGSVVRSGLLQRIKDALKEEELFFTELSGVRPNPRLALAEEGVKKGIAEGVDFIGRQQGYSEAYRLPDYVPESSGGESSSLGSESGAPVRYDTLFADIARAAVSQGQISTSSIQRNYEVGFNRAGRIMMQLERAGIVGRQEGAKPRDILFHDLPSLEARLQELGVF